ncbi:radical SAM protein [Henriciella mobilis]|uniref:radical SAM protein n=1 Tax=Henriciella mobilis TaxID=2305467 RepID=UPI000E66B44D|nr:radical SAM protein [Henriciella mobilis]RIJ18222.1 radical SAM protein [Henriciella mobilis]RIJ24971.1 radical SAM protein [Henriciella mobilis]
MAHTTLIQQKFHDPFVTAKGETRGSVDWRGLKTLWLNTGTLCNIACRNCYIKSSPTNDDLAYLTLGDVMPFLDEIDALGDGTKEIGITGGEPFMCPDILAIMEAILSRGHRLLLLTNAMRPMMRPRIREGLLALKARFGGQMTLRVSMDHYLEAPHDEERGTGSFAAALEGLSWLAGEGFRIAIAGRQALSDDDAQARAGYGALIGRFGLGIDPSDARQLVLFPEMIEGDDPPEITTACWSILNIDPSDMMCASQRMIVKRQGAARPVVTACTLLPYDSQFELGETLSEATAAPVQLNHAWCASFCVLGGGSCSA